jgi:hypothetical protein
MCGLLGALLLLGFVLGYRRAGCCLFVAYFSGFLASVFSFVLLLCRLFLPASFAAVVCIL